MRYMKQENTWVLGNLTPASTVMITIVNLEDDSLVTLATNNCTESAHIPGMYSFDIETNIVTPPTGYVNYAYQMQDSEGNTFRGKFIYGGGFDDVKQHVTKTNIVFE